MIDTGFIALRGLHALHMVDRHIIKEVEVGARHTRIMTPYHVIEVETRANVDALSTLCGEARQVILATDRQTGQKQGEDLYPRLADLPF